MADYIRKQSSGFGRSFYATLTDINGPVDLPAGTVITFIAKRVGVHVSTDAAEISAPGVVIAPDAPIGNPDRGRVRYDPASGAMALPGIYNVEWLVARPTGNTPQRFPEDGHMVLIVLPSAELIGSVP